MAVKREVVAVFDSGVGGLTVLKELKTHNIDESFIYIADNKHAPYGDKNKKQVIQYVKECFRQLEDSYRFKAIVLACNTASVFTKDLLQSIYHCPVLSVLDAATEHVKSLHPSAHIDVLATTLTANSHAYKLRLPNHSIREIACPSFVPLVESQQYLNHTEVKHTIKRELSSYRTDITEYVVLGCTHYPMLEDELQCYYGVNCKIINPSVVLGNALKEYFPKTNTEFQCTYMCSSPSIQFQSIAESIMGTHIRVIHLTKESTTYFPSRFLSSINA